MEIPLTQGNRNDRHYDTASKKHLTITSINLPNAINNWIHTNGHFNMNKTRCRSINFNHPITFQLYILKHRIIGPKKCLQHHSVYVVKRWSMRKNATKSGDLQKVGLILQDRKSKPRKGPKNAKASDRKRRISIKPQTLREHRGAIKNTERDRSASRWHTPKKKRRARALGGGNVTRAHQVVHKTPHGGVLKAR